MHYISKRLERALCVCVFRRKRVEVVPDEEGEMYVESCVFSFPLTVGDCCTDEAISLPVLKNRGKQTYGSEVRFCNYEWWDRTHA